MLGKNGPIPIIPLAKGANSHLVGGRYQLGKRMQRNQQSSLYQGIDTALKQAVVLKHYPETKRALAQHEGQWLQQISHPNLIKGVGPIEWQGGLWLIMPLVSGTPLAQLLQIKGTRTWSILQCKSATRQLLDAVTSIHQHQVEHGDIKPANIIINHSKLTLLDYSSTCPLGTTRAPCYGTPPWQPCQDSKSVDGSRDWYSAALIIWSIWSGHYPLSSDKSRVIAPWPWRRRHFRSAHWLKKQLINPTELNWEGLAYHFG